MQRVSGWSFVAERLKMSVVVLGAMVVGMVFLEVNGGSMRAPGAASGPGVDVTARGLPGGVELNVEPHRFAWAGAEDAGQGRSGASLAGGVQVFLDGRLMAELYGPRVVLPDVAPGSHRVRVALVDIHHRPVGAQREVLVTVP
ncbi:MAG: hypothetical protein QJR01_09070 [Kyrpidia sp.]|nr:hypothetical protein [Kyrpidia sp.]